MYIAFTIMGVKTHNSEVCRLSSKHVSIDRKGEEYVSLHDSLICAVRKNASLVSHPKISNTSPFDVQVIFKIPLLELIIVTVWK